VHLRKLIIASAFIVASGMPGPTSAGDGYSDGKDRPGGDYRSFDLKGDAQDCRNTCEREKQCRAWSFVKAPNNWHGTERPPARCWLKNVVPPARANPCCTSGVTGGQRID